jgi:tripartite-type tricarboxylate transporter receptor subunit TctC
VTIDHLLRIIMRRKSDISIMAGFLESERKAGGAMKRARRKFLHFAAGASALPTVSRVATAQTYPSRPITIVVPFAAGGFNVLDDLVPISPINTSPFVLFARKAMPAADLNEFVSWLKTNPDRASAGIISASANACVRCKQRWPVWRSTPGAGAT